VAELEVATAVRPVHGSGGRYAAELDPAWRIGTKANGGYLLALVARAALDAAGPDHPHPVAASAHYLAAPRPGPAEIEVAVLRRGRSAVQLRAGLLVGGSRCVEALVTCGRLPAGGAPYWDGVPVPQLPAEEDCVPVPPEDPRFPVPMFGEVALRLDPATAGFALGRPAGAGEIRGWARISPQPPDPYALLVAVDCLPPATFDLGLAGSWVPTLELTAHLRALPAAGPLRVRQRARLVAHDRVDEDCDVWDSTGALVASGRQLAAVRLPRAPA
jgi:Acyl-CoA thioesterase C-terminal domain/Acyl-CoA thioesterase N-terminal domain